MRKLINMDSIRQERPNESLILKLNKRLKYVTKRETCDTRQGIYGLLGLEKTNSVTFLEVKLLMKTAMRGEKLSTSQKLKVP